MSDADKLSKFGATMGMTKKAGQVGIASAQQSKVFSQAGSEPSVPEQPAGTQGSPLGLDVSGWQGNVDWNYVSYMKGARFAYIKASEGTWASNSYFAQQYNGSAAAGLIRGAYHFARPNLSRGADQATAFIANGGAWSGDGTTLPGALDIEGHPDAYNGSPYNEGLNSCYNMSPSQLSDWVADFAGYYYQATGKAAVIYSTASFWNTCLGGTTRFSNSNPLWGASWFTNNPASFGGWGYYSVWQYADDYTDASYSTKATFPGDQDLFNGTMDQLRRFASTPDTYPIGLIPGATLLTGKWGGDGKSYVGWFKDGFWCLQMPRGPRKCFGYGNPGDKPVVGDWNGTGSAGIGIVRNGVWWLVGDINTMAISKVVSFGIGSDTPIVGDWNGSGRDSIGIWRNSSFQVSYSINNPVVNEFTGFGVPSDTPIVGDWTGSGKTSIGVWRNGQWWLSSRIQSPVVSNVFNYGISTDSPITGDWNGDRTSTVGIVRGNSWQLTNSLSQLSVDVLYY
ncbi:GH25 family lysozyme [Arthrobacter sp. MMS18-M83]|uniref:GH25 family lysozyme n=1 Tax=Arthrobacter sp. MMS18-M83 TaxID=2996261 RepID=UPI00227BC15D|nr:GH25 family lysozyme [Arthrobacter sp. MMS18-M83]WAH96533.1 GH25 family lysozyme [Arthrobacter sp. MMS18-M83]